MFFLQTNSIKELEKRYTTYHKLIIIIDLNLWELS